MSADARPWPATFTLYRGLTGLLSGHLGRMARRRHAAMGAQPDRLRERFGHPTRPRPEGRLVWINAASMGEVRAALAVVGALGKTSVLLTTTTQTGADRAAADLPDTGQHQFAPLDTGAAMDSFLAHWRPDLAVFLESEVPMRAVDMLARRGTPMAWLNVRPSRTRARFPGLFAAAMDRMAIVTTQDRSTETELRDLGLREAQFAGAFDLKALAPPPIPDPRITSDIRAALGQRPVWLALSIHPEEAPVIAAAERIVSRAVPDARLIVIPRHPDRADQIRRAFPGEVTLRSAGAAPGAIHLADTTGEVGSFLALSRLAIIGATFADLGGHSPAEAFALGTPVIHGPFPGVQTAQFAAARAAGAAVASQNAEELADAVIGWLATPDGDRAAAAALALSQRSRAPLEALGGRLLGLMS